MQDTALQVITIDGPPVLFDSRDQIETASLLDQGMIIPLEGNFRGSRTVRIPRWTIRKAYNCSKAVAQIIAELFPNDLIFLVQLDWSKRKTAVTKLWEVLFEKIYHPMLKVTCVTLDVHTEADVARFIDNCSPQDLMDIFTCIIQQEINNERVAAILKKAQRLINERFHLANASFDIVGTWEQMLRQSSTPAQSNNSSSSINTQHSL